jgi:hypothetical protein
MLFVVVPHIAVFEQVKSDACAFPASSINKIPNKTLRTKTPPMWKGPTPLANPCQ